MPDFRSVLITIGCSALLSLYLYGAPLYGRELPLHYNALQQVNNLSQLLDQQSGRYQLLVADLFEKKHLYRPYISSAMLADLRYIPKPPKGAAFDKESKLIRDFIDKDARFQQTLLIHTSFNLPGEENFSCKLLRPIPLKGRPYRASLWVYSQLYPHRLKLIFQNRGREIFTTATEPLLWHGWRRLDLPLTRLQNSVKRRRTAGKFSFSGFIIASSPRAEAGQLSLMIDNLLILSDIRELHYPGFEVEDAWK